MAVDLTKRPDPIREARRVRLDAIAQRLEDFVDVLHDWHNSRGEPILAMPSDDLVDRTWRASEMAERTAERIRRQDSLETVEEDLTDLIKTLTAIATATGASPAEKRPVERIRAPERRMAGVAIWRLAMPLVIDRDWIRREIDEDTERSLGKISSKHSSQRSRERKRLGYTRFYVDVHKTDLEALRQMRLLRKDADREEQERVLQQVVHAALGILVANTFRPFRTPDEAAAIAIEVWQDRLAQLARVERGRPEMWDGDFDDVYPEEPTQEEIMAALGHEVPPSVEVGKRKRPKGA